ncbi:hypothetical protein [Parapedomonas caeni]
MTSRWLAACMAGALCLALVWLVMALADPLSVQDDVRQHIAWLEAIRDPRLFVDDPIARYFEASNTQAFKLLYTLPAHLGVSPLLLAKLYPALLTLLLAWTGFHVLRGFDLAPPAAGLGSLLLIQALWVTDDLACASARAFAWLWLMVMLLGWRRRWLMLAGASGLLLGLTYPPVAVLTGVTLGLVGVWQLLRRERPDWSPGLVMLGTLMAGTLAVTLTGGSGGPLVTGVEARGLAEFAADGRTPFFAASPVTYWLFGARSGALPVPGLRHGLALLATLIALALAGRLPVDLRRLAIAALAAGWMLWALAHAVLFDLYLPARFALTGLRLAVALLAGWGLWWMLGRLSVWPRRLLVGTLVLLPLAGLAAPPSALGLVSRPLAPEIIVALRRLPTESLIAGNSADLDMVPALAGRSVLAAREFHVAYHRDYREVMRQRLADSIAATYALSAAPVATVRERYSVTHLLVDRGAFNAQAARQAWWYGILAQTGHLPACTASTCGGWVLARPACIVAEQNRQALLSVDCLLDRPDGLRQP